MAQGGHGFQTSTLYGSWNQEQEIELEAHNIDWTNPTVIGEWWGPVSIVIYSGFTLIKMT